MGTVGFKSDNTPSISHIITVLPLLIKLINDETEINDNTDLTDFLTKPRNSDLENAYIKKLVPQLSEILKMTPSLSRENIASLIRQLHFDDMINIASSLTRIYETISTNFKYKFTELHKNIIKDGTTESNEPTESTKGCSEKFEKEFINLMNYLSTQLKDLQLEFLILNTKYNNELQHDSDNVEYNSENTRLEDEKKSLEEKKNLLEYENTRLENEKKEFRI
jgi:hypothetical protein